MASRSKTSKSSRSKSSHGSSSVPAPSAQTWPSISFLFTVDELRANDDLSQGGLPPRVNDNGRWLPPLYRAGFWPTIPGRVYRWNNGIISPASECRWYDGRLCGPSNTPLNHYRSTTVFWCNDWTQFLVAEGDVTQRDIETSEAPYNRWYPLSFDHDRTLSRVDASFEEQYLAGTGAAWIAQLGLSSHDNRRTQQSGGLAGNLSIVVALVAFSCQLDELDNILLRDMAWTGYDWIGHRSAHGREEGRGMVVSVYLDPRNTEGGSTTDTLSALEWSVGPILR